jgi:iron complex outermembrane recepter protein
VKPEKIGATELGYKVAEGPLRFSAAAFYYDYKDVQVTTYEFFSSTVANAAAVHIYGLDADLTYQVTPDFEFTFSGAYAHAIYASFPNASAWSQNLNPASPNYGVISQISIDATGLPVERTPSFSGSLSADYGFDVAGGRLVVNGNLFYTAKYYFDVAEQAPQNAYSLLNLRATWTDPKKRYDISVFGTNVTNTKYYIQSFIDPSAFRSTYGEPAMFGGSVTFHF